MAQDLVSLLSTPLAELRGHWLEETCRREPVRSPMWFHAAHWSGWLLSDLALVTQDKIGQPADTGRIELVSRFDKG